MKKILSSKEYGFYERKEAFMYLSNKMKKDSFIVLVNPNGDDAYYSYILDCNVTDSEKFSCFIPALKESSLLYQSGLHEVSKLKWVNYFKQKEE